MSSLTVKRWRRYGNDRIYVSLADGSPVGWYDVVTGTSHLAEPGRANEFERSVADALREGNSPDACSTAAPRMPEPMSRPGTDARSDEPAIESDAEEPAAWQDLATQRAGAAARSKAHTLKEAAPIRTAIARLLRVHTDERAWRIGADGEEKVAARLAKLTKKDPRWRFLHAVPVGSRNSDIDHLVIGPAGVFTLNAKHHPNAKVVGRRAG